MARPIIVSICSLTGLVRLEWAIAFRQQIVPFGRDVIISIIERSSPVSAARNLAIYEAQKRDAKYMLFWDDDLIPRLTNAFAQLIGTMDNVLEATLVGSVCPIRREPAEPVVVKEEGGGAWYGWRDGKIHPVYSSGTAFLLIRMEDLEDIDVPEIEIEGDIVKQYFSEYSSIKDEPVSDDFYLAELMAKHNKLWLVHGGVVCHQIDQDKKWYKVVGEEDFKPIEDIVAV